MKHYTETIPVALAKKLKDAGLSIETEGNNIWCPSYAEAFDWLMEKSVNIYLDFDNGLWSWFIESDFALKRTEDYPSWHEAANAAIEEALELIKED